MAKTAIGNKGMESAVRGLPVGESVVLLARGYDQLVKDLEFALSHISEENLHPLLKSKLQKGDD